MSDDYLVRKQVVLEYTNIDFKQWLYWIFSKGSTHDFGQKMEILSLYVFGEMDLEILFDDHCGRKQALLYYKIFDITKLPCWHFFIGGLTQEFGQKLQISFLFPFFLGKISLEIMSDDHLLKNQALSQSKVLAISCLIHRFFLATNHSRCINFCPKSVRESAM